MACLFTVFNHNTPWIWENLDNTTINNLLAEHHELHRSPEDKQKDQMEKVLDKQISENPLVKAFMAGEVEIGDNKK